MKKIIRSTKFSRAILLLVALLAVGVLGFIYLSDYSFIDALYMSVITITTVGFAEVNPLDAKGKLFTITLILSSIVIVGYALSIITEYILSNQNIEQLKRRRMQKKIDALTNHIIISGFGRNGRQVAKKLMSHDQEFVVIDANLDIIESYDSSGILFVNGNTTEDSILVQAGIERAKTFIAALPDDANNLFAVLSAKQLNKNLHIISRASKESSLEKLKLAGADNVILPDRIGGDHMASLVVSPDLVEFIDNLAVKDDNNANIEEIDTDKLYDTSKVQTIRNLDLRRRTGCSVIGFKAPNGCYEVNPDPNTKLVAQSKIIVLGRPDQIRNLNLLYNI